MTTINTTMKNARFHLDFVNRKIVGTKASFDKASKGVGEIYEELAAKVAAHPDFVLDVKEQKRRSNKKKETYDGLTFGFMKLYLSLTQKDGEARMQELEKIRSMAKEINRSPYPIAKKWFLETNEDFNMKDAREAITDALVKKAAAADANSKVEAATTNDAEMNEEAEKLIAEMTPAA